MKEGMIEAAEEHVRLLTEALKADAERKKLKESSRTFTGDPVLQSLAVDPPMTIPGFDVSNTMERLTEELKGWNFTGSAATPATPGIAVGERDTITREPIRRTRAQQEVIDRERKFGEQTAARIALEKAQKEHIERLVREAEAYRKVNEEARRGPNVVTSDNTANLGTSGEMGTQVGFLQSIDTSMKKGRDPNSFYVHDVPVETAIQALAAQLGTGVGTGTGTGTGAAAEEKEFVPQWEGEVEGWRDTKRGMTGSAAPGSTDAFGNPIGEPIKKGMFAGIIDPFKKLFTDDSPWMTKLGDFFSGDSEFLSGLSGLFGGLGDIMGKLFGSEEGWSGAITGVMGLLGLAQGGIAPGGFRKFARGGIATSPTLGLIGEGRHNEAVVPLPNGKAIPVDMRSNAQTNNVTVNVSSDGQTTTEGQDNEGLGKAIAKAVQEELQNQKRAGGILNRYGTA